MIYYVDIDDTICKYPDERIYQNAVPIKERIEAINKLYNEGNTIVYWTARGGTTGIDWTELTTTQLSKWEALHHELKMWKPHYDYFICDKAINSEKFFKNKK
tara:strand:+ start:371 stop:676 length:306 start_codon:yes stop_codon:yes gene_type:complete